MIFKPDEELAGWLKERGMRTDEVVLPDDRLELLEKHRAQAATIRYLGKPSQENWAIWTTLTHPGHVAKAVFAGTDQPIAVALQNARLDEIALSLNPPMQEPVPREAAEPTPAPEPPPVIEHHTHPTVRMGWRDWLTIGGLIALAETLLRHL